MRNGNGRIEGERLAAPQLEEIDAALTCNFHRVLHQGPHGRCGAEWAAVVHERHGDEIVPKQEAPGPDERQHAGQVAGFIVAREIQAIVVEDVFDDVLPAPAVEIRPAGVRLHARVPLGFGSPKRLYVQCHAQTAATSGGRPRDAAIAATVSRTAVKRNSLNRRASCRVVRLSPP